MLLQKGNRDRSSKASAVSTNATGILNSLSLISSGSSRYGCRQPPSPVVILEVVAIAQPMFVKAVALLNNRAKNRHQLLPLKRYLLRALLIANFTFLC